MKTLQRIQLGSLVTLTSAALLLLATMASAGDLEPSGPPAPTMKTLDQIPGSWDRVLDSTNGDADGCNSDRFKCVMNGEAVLDLETGLVFQRDLFYDGGVKWIAARHKCLNLRAGDRYGWRLASIDELSSLFEALPAPSLPPGHPFHLAVSAPGPIWSGNPNFQTWTATPPSHAWVVNVHYPSGAIMESFEMIETHAYLCVRGPGSTPPL